MSLAHVMAGFTRILAIWRESEAYILPGLAAIDRFVDSIAKGNISADAGFSRSHINDVWIGWGNREGSNRGNGLIVE